jgi:hypothetical protein
MATLQAIKYQRGSLDLLDQRLLPFETVYLPVPDPQTAWQHIKDMVVRGAPAIGVTGALSLAVDLVSKGAGSQFADVQAAVQGISETLDFLVTRWGLGPGWRPAGPGGEQLAEGVRQPSCTRCRARVGKRAAALPSLPPSACAASARGAIRPSPAPALLPSPRPLPPPLSSPSPSPSRPTAVNLKDAADKHKVVAARAAAAPGATPASVVEAVVAAAEAFYDQDIASNKVGGAGRGWQLLRGAPGVLQLGQRCRCLGVGVGGRVLAAEVDSAMLLHGGVGVGVGGGAVVAGGHYGAEARGIEQLSWGPHSQQRPRCQGQAGSAP